MSTVSPDMYNDLFLEISDMPMTFHDDPSRLCKGAFELTDKSRAINGLNPSDIMLGPFRSNFVTSDNTSVDGINAELETQTLNLDCRMDTISLQTQHQQHP